MADSRAGEGIDKMSLQHRIVLKDKEVLWGGGGGKKQNKNNPSTMMGVGVSKKDRNQLKAPNG